MLTAISMFLRFHPRVLPDAYPPTFATTGDVQWPHENGEIRVLLVGTRVSDVPDLLFSIQSRPPEADPVT